MSPAPAPLLDDWKRLYDLATRVRQLAPWDWMEEVDIFGVQEPASREFGYVSVMGALGEHLSVGVYPGARGLSGFWRIQESAPHLTHQAVLLVPQLQVSFVNREEITAEDRKVIKALGLKFRGAQAWTQFRSFRPSCLPWYLEKSEVEMLACAMEQVLEVAPRFRENPRIFAPTDSEYDYLVRVRNNGQWENSILRVEPDTQTSLEVKMNPGTLKALKNAMPGRMVLEADLFMLEEPVQEKRGERPFFPYMLMLVEHDSGMVLASELLSPLPSFESMLGEIPTIITRILAGRFPPREVQVRDPMLSALVKVVAQETGFKVTNPSRLRALDHARKDMQRFFDLRR